MSRPLTVSFFNRSPEIVAPELLGKLLIRKKQGKLLVGKIVETEAYLSKSDPAAHSYRGKTKRTEVLYGRSGMAYIYHIHQYYCLNVSTDKIGLPGCVLIRALEPLKNIDNPTNGPGKLCSALDITLDLYGSDMTNNNSSLFIADNHDDVNTEIMIRRRIGISKAVNMPLRFFIKDNPFVSR